MYHALAKGEEDLLILEELEVFMDDFVNVVGLSPLLSVFGEGTRTSVRAVAAF